MFELLKSGGWLMLPILASSVLALAICIERALVLRREKVAPADLLSDVWSRIQAKQMTVQHMQQLRDSSALGRIMAAGLNNARHGREIMKESIQEAGSHEVHELEKFLNALGTIAAITPLLGLLGTVIGMIKVFTEIMVQGTGNPNVLAGGISEALITTAAGLSVAIPALIFLRYYQRKIDTLVVEMEQDALKLVEIVHGEREVDNG